MGASCRHLRLATLVDSVVIASFCTRRRDPPPSTSPTQHPYMPLPSTTHSHTPHGMSANLIKLLRNIPLRDLSTPAQPLRGHFGVWIPNLGALLIIASVSLTHIPCLFVCFYESVSYVYVLFSTCLFTCAASVAWFVSGFVFITTVLFSFFFFCEFNT